MSTVYDRDGSYLGRLGDVFGDPTRRAVYRHLRDASDPLSAGEVAESFGVHRTVARAHLERLAEVGLVELSTRRRASGGRPAKTYTLNRERLEIMLPPRRYERLARLLLQLLDTTLEPAAAAEAAFRTGRAYGEDTAHTITGEHGDEPVHLPPAAVLGWMDEAGYGVALGDAAPGVTAVEVHNCIYSELSAEYPDIVCKFDCGTVCGMLGIDESQHVQTHALSTGDAYCRHEFRL